MVAPTDPFGLPAGFAAGFGLELFGLPGFLLGSTLIGFPAKMSAMRELRADALPADSSDVDASELSVTELCDRSEYPSVVTELCERADFSSVATLSLAAGAGAET